MNDRSISYDLAVCSHEKRIDEKTIDVVSFSIITPVIPPKSGVKRIKRVIFSWRIEEIGSKTSVSLICQMNMGGLMRDSALKRYLIDLVSSCLERIRTGVSVDILTPPSSPPPQTIVDKSRSSVSDGDLVKERDELSPLEEPESDFSYHPASLAALERYLSLKTNPGWSFSSEIRGVNIFTCPSLEGSPVPIVRGELTWRNEMSGDAVDNFIKVVLSVEARKVWDVRFDNALLVEWLNPRELIGHAYIKPMFPVSGRDVVVVQSRIQRGRITYVIQTSMPDDAYPGHEPGGGSVRAKVRVSCWELERDEKDKDLVRIGYLMDMDPNGNIPQRLLKLVRYLRT